MAETHVQVGQIWIDNDPRNQKNPRRLCVDAVYDRFATVRNASTGRVTRVALDRLKPTTTGYRLES